MFAREFDCGCFEVHDAKQRIGRRFDPQQARIGPHCGGNFIQIGKIDERKLETGGARAHLAEQPQGSAIHVSGGDDVGTGIEQFQDRRRRGHP